MEGDRLHRLLYVGQLAFFKAPMILAAAFERILAQHPEATLTWVCDARHHAEAALLLSSQARARVNFMDWVPQERLLDIYDAHGVFLFPSFFEGFGKAFLEAMARGLVVIASEEGGAKEEEVVLMIRGELLKKYPTAVIYAQRAVWRDKDGVPIVNPSSGQKIDPTKEREVGGIFLCQPYVIRTFFDIPIPEYPQKYPQIAAIKEV